MVHIFKTVSTVGISQAQMRKVVSAVLSRVGRSADDVSIHWVGAERMRTLNRRYRGKDRPTDVLSFAAEEGWHIMKQAARDLGDVFLCVPQIERQAKQYGVTYIEEATRMLAHGVLHLAGFDHRSRKEAKTMFGIQEKIVRAAL